MKKCSRSLQFVQVNTRERDMLLHIAGEYGCRVAVVRFVGLDGLVSDDEDLIHGLIGEPADVIETLAKAVEEAGDFIHDLRADGEAWQAEIEALGGSVVGRAANPRAKAPGA